MNAQQTSVWPGIKGWSVEFGLGVAVYLVAYVAALRAAMSLPPGTVRTMLILSPIAPGLFLIWNSVRWYRRCDEYVRLRILQATAVVAVFTAVWTLIYPYLELLGLPHLNVGLVHAFGWPIFMIAMVRLLVTGR